MALEDVAASFIASAEGTDLRNASNADFVKLLYQRGLDRPADAGGLQYWTGRVAADGKATVLAEMSESAEHVDIVDPKMPETLILDRYTIPGS
mgnify:FL=1